MSEDWTKWHVGQKVVCVDDTKNRTPEYAMLIRRGEVYTIRDVRIDPAGGLGVLLEEIYRPEARYASGDEIGFKEFRFRPLVTKSDPLEIFRAMTRNTPAQNETRIRELEKA